MDITEKVKTAAPEMEEFIPDNIWDGTKIDGKIYAVPTYKDSSMTQFWYFDHEKVEKYDIDVDSVHTMDDLTPIFKKVKEGEGEKFDRFFHFDIALEFLLSDGNLHSFL